MGTARRPPSSLGGQKPLTITERERETHGQFYAIVKCNIESDQFVETVP